MGLLLSSIKIGGNTFETAYAKVSNVRYDNDSKIATFSIDIYADKDDDIPAKTLKGVYAKIVAGSDMTTQCYERLTNYVNSLTADVESVEAKIAAESDINTVYFLEKKLVQLKKNIFLQLADATSDEATEDETEEETTEE